MEDSKYLKYFVFSGDSALCQNCQKILTRKNGNTSSLRRHLENKHPNAFENLLETEKVNKVSQNKKFDCLKKQQQILKRSVVHNHISSSTAEPPIKKQCTITESLSQWSVTGDKTEKGNRALTQMLAVDCLPFNLVDNPGFRNFMKVVAPQFHPVCRTTITRRILPQLYEEYHAKVKEKLQQADCISLTSDVWSSKDGRLSIVSLTAHFIENGRPEILVPGVLAINGRHTADNISIVLSESLKDFEIPENKVHLFLRDAGSNMVLATNILGKRL